MQITKAEVTPAELKLQHPARMAGLPTISNIQVVFVRLETRQGQSAWGCPVAHADLTGEKPEDVKSGSTGSGRKRTTAKWHRAGSLPNPNLSVEVH